MVTLIILGDNVSIGANSTLIGPELTIASNVEIGAMSFVNPDIPSNSIFYTAKESVILEKPREYDQLVGKSGKRIDNVA